MLHGSVAATATTLKVSVAGSQPTLQVSIDDTKATLQVSVAFLITNTATTFLTGRLVIVSCNLGSSTNAMLKFSCFFWKNLEH